MLRVLLCSVVSVAFITVSRAAVRSLALILGRLSLDMGYVIRFGFFEKGEIIGKAAAIVIIHAAPLIL